MASFITLNPNQKDEIIDALTSTSGSSGVASAISNLDVNGTGIISELQTFNTNFLTQLQLLNANIELFNKNVDSVIWQQQNILGAKNLLKYPYFYTEQITYRGVTFTIKNDGSIETSGTATQNILYYLHVRNQGETNDFVLKNGSYIGSGCPSDGSATTYSFKFERTFNGDAVNVGVDTGNGVSFTLNGDDFSPNEVNLSVIIDIRQGVNTDGLIFKPMIRLATINDDTFTPYTMTNQEITRYINSIQGGV